ncbi:uncharacterized protein A4U43_C04F10280 [Asparagus officinalis]|uniref:CSC1/OSCA1-like 7TM region domain-containing protein n=1 Tax=Asparagus officinalis TaxID=4686 RepID=A0A5P1F089_ASPOF|nr:CSC1-like protein At1g32090 [Asparagus officinalis]ONK71592.1 uncharacterized protein A4U43_C04F10280 [Asparagus officinalis]
MGLDSLKEIGASALTNLVTTFIFLLAFAFLRIQPANDRVYFSKWYVLGQRSSPAKNRTKNSSVGKFVNLNLCSYFTVFNWMPKALMMREKELVEHAGFDSFAFLRIYILGLKIFFPITILVLLVLIPVNVYHGTLLKLQKEIVFSNIDKLSISNVDAGSKLLWVHLLLEYLLTMWTCFCLYKEYDSIASLRLQFQASQHRRADQFTVLVRNFPHITGGTISKCVDDYFQRNHPDHYLGHQAVYNANKFAKLVKKKKKLKNWLDYYCLKFERNPDKRPTIKKRCLGLFGERVDSIESYKERIKELDKKLAAEKEMVLKNPKAVVPVAFVTFDSRWAAAICAQTQQSRNPTRWLTYWAPEPRDVYWKNLAIPFVSLGIRKILMSVAAFALLFFYMIPIAFVQTIANLETLEKYAPFLRPVVEQKVIKSFLQGFLPGLALKIFMCILPKVLMIMSKVEGHFSLSALERRAADLYFYFIVIDVFMGSIVTGTAFEQLKSLLHQPPSQIPSTVGVSIPMKATFFITYIMVDGWSSIASEILRITPLVIYSLKNMFLVKTDRDRAKAMKPPRIKLTDTLPTIQLYFLLGLVYAVVSPILLPFILVSFAFAYLVYRHQIINVYNQKYESAGAFWPHVHTQMVISLLISHILLLGLLSTKKAAYSTPLLLALPLLTFCFHKYCKSRFEPAFRKQSLEEAMDKDIKEKATEPSINLKDYLADAYLHPIFHSIEETEMIDIEDDQSQTDKGSPRSNIVSSPYSSPKYSFDNVFDA